MTGQGESIIPGERQSASSMASSDRTTTNNMRVESSHFPQPQQLQQSQRPQVHHHFIHNQAHVKISADRIVGALSCSSSIIPGPKLIAKASAVSTTGATQKSVRNPSDTTQEDGKSKAQKPSTNNSAIDGTTKKQGVNTDSQSVSPTNSSKTSEGASEDSVDGEKKRGGKSKAGKKDRSKLRKGKWTVEEEEYTSRIIHHFSTGLLTLPEGTTLRSYLAEKLNCDPMRITKKFAGASCLGKRVYHLCDRSQATVTDIEMAKAELARLEHRFRLRVEHGQSGVPLPPRAEVVPSMPHSAAQMYAAPGPASVAASWLQSIASTITAQHKPGNLPLAPNQVPQPLHQPPSAPSPWPFMANLSPGTQWVNPATMPPPGSKPVSTTMPPPITSSIHTATNEAITLAWAQAAASLTPALSQLAAANLQQHQQQLQKAYESQVQSYTQQQPSPVPKHPNSQGFSAAPSPMSFTPAPRQQQPLAPASFQHSPTAMAPPPNVAPIAQSQSFARQSAIPIAPQPAHSFPTAAKPPTTSQLLPRPPQKVILKPVANKIVVAPSRSDSPGRSEEDEAAGSMLMGFLTSLRQGFMEAKSIKDKEDCTKSMQQVQVNKAAALAVLGDNQETESGTTSYPADSSPEDSQSEQGGKDPSSSEESDSLDRPRGPPRKRLKTKIGEFTSRNVAAHTSRMNALHHAEKQQQSDAYAANGVQKEVAKSV